MLQTNPFAYKTQLAHFSSPTQRGNTHQKNEEERMADEKGEKGHGVAEDRSAMASARNVEGEEEEMTKSGFRTTEVLLRLIPMSLCVVSLVIMLKDSQDAGDYGSISYSDVGAFKYLVHANGICAGYSLLSAVIASMPRQSTLSKAWTFFFLDQLLTYAILAAGAISMEVLYLAYNGDKSITWSTACVSFSTFCSKATAAIATTFASVACFAVVSLFSSYKLFSRYSAPAAHHPSKTIECLSCS